MEGFGISQCPVVRQTAVKCLDACEHRGWASFVINAASERLVREQMLAIASQLGTPVTTRAGGDLIDILVPTNTEDAKSSSLSKVYSTAEFPLHVDTAHWLTPCRYIVLACVWPGSSGRSTLLLDTRNLHLDDRQLALLHGTPLRVTNGRNSFFSTILSRSRPFVRYDPGCMTAATPEGTEALAVLSRSRWDEVVEEVHWQPAQVVILDNWRLLHGRGQAKGVDSDRKLLRASIT